MNKEVRMKVALVVATALALTACCVFGGPLPSTGIDLSVSATWDGVLPPLGTTAVVDFYLMAEGTGSWVPLELNVPYPGFEGTLVDTFWFEYELPVDGTHMTYRYEVDMTIDGATHSYVCESGHWWWYAPDLGEVCCRERAR
jgi:hypothetical protein